MVIDLALLSLERMLLRQYMNIFSLRCEGPCTHLVLLGTSGIQEEVAGHPTCDVKKEYERPTQYNTQTAIIHRAISGRCTYRW